MAELAAKKEAILAEATRKGEQVEVVAQDDNGKWARGWTTPSLARWDEFIIVDLCDPDDLKELLEEE